MTPDDAPQAAASIRKGGRMTPTGRSSSVPLAVIVLMIFVALGSVAAAWFVIGSVPAAVYFLTAVVAVAAIGIIVAIRDCH